jgi:hypothetical protein
MFSLMETERGKLIYRCHGCGSERELNATDQVAAADEAVACNAAHQCGSEMPLFSAKEPKAS